MRRTPHALVMLCCLALIGARVARADVAPLAATAESSLGAAQAAYDKGTELQRSDPAAARAQFEAAERGFRELVDGGAFNGPLLYNLGNAQMQLGQTGAAIGSYLKAQRLMPGDSRLQANLAHARSMVKDRLDRGEGLLLQDVAAWWHLLPQASRLALGSALWLLAWGLLIVRLALRSPAWLAARGTASACWGLAIAGAALLATVVVEVNAPAWRPVGVTVSDGVVVRKGNGDGFEPAFAEPLSQGVEFSVLERRPGWLQIRLPDGKSGWIRDLQASTA